MKPIPAILAGLLLAPLLVSRVIDPAAAQLRGHGGPVRAVIASADGQRAISGGFDQSAIVWDVETGAARAVLRFHDGAVNAIAALPDGGFATGGEDGRIALFRPGEGNPARVFAEHRGPVVGLAVSPDGTQLASAAWDGTVRVRPLAGGEARVLEGHRGNVNAVAYLPDGRLVSAGYDAAVRIWPVREGAPLIAALPSPANALAVSPEGEIAVAGADGVVRLLGPDGGIVASIEASRTPITALALSPDGAQLAAATIAGEIVLIDWPRRQVVRRIAGGGQPVWAVAFWAGGHELLSGGGDGLIRRWAVATDAAIGALTAAVSPEKREAAQGDRGAELFRACAACHALSAAAENRAGPSLHGVFGRRIASLPDYNFSAALQRLDIVWSAETIGRLFEIGPGRYTPGTKMPEQIIADRDDREALVRFLEAATKPR